MNDDFELEMSPLCQSISSGGRTVQIEIYKSEQGLWILEIEDEFGNSTVWDSQFTTDQAALTEAKRAILEERIVAFIGPEDGKSDGSWK